MISPDRALEILEEENCPSNVIDHSLAVRDVSVEIAREIQESGREVDIDLVEVGALLHDVGRSKTHEVSHCIKGAKILGERGLDRFAGFAEDHVGAGITAEESRELGLPAGDHIPRSVEEKIVTYADNLIRGPQRITFQEALDEFRKELGSDHPSLDRFLVLHDELKKLGMTEYKEG